MKRKWLCLNWLNAGPKSKFVAITTSLLLVLVLQGHSHAQSSQIQGPRDNAQVYSGVVYGPIDQNDTLWRIASRYKQDSQFSVYQVMLAIYELNQQAFENGNFNTMVNGATLRLPSDRYIARMDVQAGRAKAERDDRAFGRQNSVRTTNPQNNSQATTATPEQVNQANLKPEVPLVNQDDLSKTQSQLQNQLNGLRRQQQEQFVALKNQVAASINSVEILLDENRKLNERLQQIDDNNRNLTTKVETELQVQIDQQVEQLNQLIELITDAEQRRIDEESKSILAILSSNTAIILMSVGFTLLALIGFGIFLLRKTGPEPAAANDSPKSTKENDDIVDDDLVIGELDDETDQDSDDLLAALEQDANAQDDDILSDELEDDDVLAALDDDDLGGGFDIDDDLGPESTDGEDSLGDDFGDLDDDMLVPDSPANEKKANVEKTTEELDFDEISLDEDDDGLDGISLDEDIASEPSPTESSEEIDLSTDGSEPAGEQLDTSKAPDPTNDENPNPFDEQAEVSDDGTPDGIDLDENGDIDEDTLDQIEQKIEEKDQTINKLADELIEELDNSEGESATNEASTDNDTSLDSSENAQDAQAPEAQQIAKGDIGDSTSIDLSGTNESATVDNADVESLMEGLDDVIDMDAEDSATPDDSTDLSDELLSELEQDSEVQDELDALLADDELVEEDLQQSDVADSQSSSEANEDVLDLSGDADTDETDIEDNAIDLSGIDDAIISDDTDDSVLSDEVSALADELLEELETDEQESDELDSLLDELDEELATNDENLPLEANLTDESSDKAVNEPEQKATALDADDLLDDIPSFTSELSEEEIDDLPPEASSDSSPEESDELEESSKTSLDALVDEDDNSEDQDVLSGLPDLDDWLDEEEPVSTDSNAQSPEATKDNNLDEFDDDIKDGLDLSALELDDISLDEEPQMAKDHSEKLGLDNEDELLEGLDNADFDDMLNDLAEDESPAKDPLAQAGLDIEALMTEEDKSGLDELSENIGTKNEEIDDIDDAFVDVDDLLKESDAMPEMQDDDLDLDLERSLDKLVPSGAETADESISDDENDQASNLDLAQVYIDMEDFEAAQELLDEVARKGSEQQKAEAANLLDSFS